MSPEPSAATTPAERFRLALELFEVGEAMMRQKIARQSPELSSEQVEDRLLLWLAVRPGAEGGDAEGPPTTWHGRR